MVPVGIDLELFLPRIFAFLSMTAKLPAVCSFFDFAPFEGDVPERIGMECYFPADLVHKLAVQRISIAEHENVRSRVLCGEMRGRRK